MYTQQDREIIGKRLRKYVVIALVVLATLIAGDIVGMAKRWEAWVMADGALIFVVACFMWIMYIWPSIRYRRFLIDMQNGLARELRGRIVEVSETEEDQDGVRVCPLKIFLEDEQDERIVYLNVTKESMFPKTGAQVALVCFGRHIKEAALI